MCSRCYAPERLHSHFSFNIHVSLFFLCQFSSMITPLFIWFLCCHLLRCHLVFPVISINKPKCSSYTYNHAVVGHTFLFPLFSIKHFMLLYRSAVLAEVCFYINCCCIPHFLLDKLPPSLVYTKCLIDALD